MKTQINKLVSGNHLNGIVGTNWTERVEVGSNVISENPEQLNVEICGYNVKLSASRSVSGKTVSYYSEIPLDLYTKFCGSFGLPTKYEPKPYMYISNDMQVYFCTNNRKSIHTLIPESNITIL